jgi:hypothetical protein
MCIDEILEQNAYTQPEDCKVETPMEYVRMLIEDCKNTTLTS